MAHQLPQRQQINAGGRQFGPVGVPQAVRPDPDSPGCLAVTAEQAAQSRLGDRRPGGRAAQHDEAFRCGQARRAFQPQIGGQLGEECLIDRDMTFLAALADHPQPAAPHIHVGELEAADLGRAQPAQQHHQHHGPVPVRAQRRHEHVNIPGGKGLGQAARLAHQPAATARAAGPQVTEQPAGRRADALTTPG